MKNSLDATELDSRRKKLIEELEKLNKRFNDKNIEKLEFLQQSAKSIYLLACNKGCIINY